MSERTTFKTSSAGPHLIGEMKKINSAYELNLRLQFAVGCLRSQIQTFDDRHRELDEVSRDDKIRMWRKLLDQAI